MMRTTLNLPDDVFQTAKSLANLKGISLGDALAELVRAGLKAPARLNTRKAFPAFELDEDAPPITLEQTLQAQDDL